MSNKKSENLRGRLGFSNVFGVSSGRLSGGLVLVWKNTLTVNLKEAVDCTMQAAALAAKIKVSQLAATTPEEDVNPPVQKKAAIIKPASEFSTKTVDLQTGDPAKTSFIRTGLSSKIGRHTRQLPSGHDIFAIKPSDMPGVPRELIEHELKINKNAKPRKQRLRRFTPDRKEAIKMELSKILAAGFIKEVFYSDWLANPVLIKKSNNEWRMYVDYTILNKHCKKDPFGLPRTDEVVDITAGCTLLCFLDYYSRYHQISLKEKDQVKTTFIMSYDVYCYETMSFGLKNVGAVYQRAIQKCLNDQLHHNVEAYVDDMVIKTKNFDDLLTDLFETFENLCKFRRKLKPTKCVFRVPSGKLLGFIVSEHGIMANPEKFTTIMNMKPLQSAKDVQKLTGCMVSLNRFISKLSEHGAEFFKMLKKQDNFRWTGEAQITFDDLKKFLTTPPVLTAPLPGEELLL